MCADTTGKHTACMWLVKRKYFNSCVLAKKIEENIILYVIQENVVCTCTIYNMSGRVVSDIQTPDEGESLYIRYNTDANVVSGS
jgi:hypothetical protein